MERLRVGCKINLFLDITGIRADGFHELETLFVPLPEPHDVLEFVPETDGPDRQDATVGLQTSASAPDALADDASRGSDRTAGAPARDASRGHGRSAVVPEDMARDDGPGRLASQVAPGLRLLCSDPSLETPGNIVVKAYEAFAARTGYRPALTIRLTKGIPHGAGLGGGSADAAAVLAWLNARAGDKSLAEADLSALAAGLGADVPFFLLGRPAWATGIGERLEPAEADLSGLTVLVCVPPERINTAWAYKAFDERAGLVGASLPVPVLTRLCPAGMRPFCVSGTFSANAFEPVVFSACPPARILKERLYALGARAAGLSGSGSAVWGLFGDASRADGAAAALSKGGARVFSALL